MFFHVLSLALSLRGGVPKAKFGYSFCIVSITDGYLLSPVMDRKADLKDKTLLPCPNQFPQRSS